LDALAERGTPAARFDTDDPCEGSLARVVVAGLRTHSYLQISGSWLCCDEVSAVLYRHLHLPEASHIEDPGARELARSELRATLEGALLGLDAHWLNHPQANRLARHKPLQLALAVREGLLVPETQITDDADEIRELYRAWGGRMVAKLAGGQLTATERDAQYAVYTTVIEEPDLAETAALSACPAIYQRLVEKDFDLRVTVVGERIFACRIDVPSSARASVDWRAADREAVSISEYEVDQDLAERCVALVRRLGLDFAGLDFIVTPTGEAIFLELNAAGRWLWVQEATGLPIASAIADRLVSAGLSHACR
jgi:glutathione synthase/RimK-type ligase-like ATP-grasp enzyme